AIAGGRGRSTWTSCSTALASSTSPACRFRIRACTSARSRSCPCSMWRPMPSFPASARHVPRSPDWMSMASRRYASAMTEKIAAPVTVPALAEAKRAGRKLAMLTAYDAGFARVCDAGGVDIVLVGDSLGMVVQGLDSTLPVTVDDIAYHTRCVARGLARALL